MDYVPSKNLIELIKKFEGLRLERYICAGGKATIGYGHVVLDHDNIGSKITAEKAEELLLYDLRLIHDRLKSRIAWKEGTGNQWDALISLAFNWGVGSLLKSNIIKYLLHGDYTTALDLWGRIVHAKGKKLLGLVRRRNAEIALFKGGGYEKSKA